MQNPNRFLENRNCWGVAEKKLNIYMAETLVSLHQKHLIITILTMLNVRGGSRAAATSKMESFVVIVNGLTRAPDRVK